MFAAGEIIEAAKLNRLQPLTGHAIGSGTVVGPQTNADVTNTTVSIDTTAANAVYTVVATWDVDLTGATTVTGTARIKVDGSIISPIIAYAGEVSTDRMMCTQVYRGTVAAIGTHTWNIAASPVANQTIQGASCAILVTVYEVV